MFECEPTPDLVLISAANLRRHGRRKQRRRRAARTQRAWPWSTEALSRASGLGLQAALSGCASFRRCAALCVCCKQTDHGLGFRVRDGPLLGNELVDVAIHPKNLLLANFLIARFRLQHAQETCMLGQGAPLMIIFCGKGLYKFENDSDFVKRISCSLLS